MSVYQRGGELACLVYAEGAVEEIALFAGEGTPPRYIMTRIQRFRRSLGGRWCLRCGDGSTVGNASDMSLSEGGEEEVENWSVG